MGRSIRRVQVGIEGVADPCQTIVTEPLREGERVLPGGFGGGPGPSGLASRAFQAVQRARAPGRAAGPAAPEHSHDLGGRDREQDDERNRDRERHRVATGVAQPRPTRVGVARERDGCGGIEALPTDAGEIDLRPRVRVTFTHQEPAGERVARARDETGHEPGRYPRGARHHDETARDLLAPTDPAVEQEVVDDIHSRGRERRVQRVLGVGAQPALECPDLVEAVRGAGRELLRQLPDARSGRAVVDRQIRLGDLRRRRYTGGCAQRGLRHRDTATGDGVDGTLAETGIRSVQPAVDVGARDAQRAVGLADDLLVGLHHPGARSREHDVRVGGLDVKRLAELVAVARSGCRPRARCRRGCPRGRRNRRAADRRRDGSSRRRRPRSRR